MAMFINSNTDLDAAKAIVIRQILENQERGKNGF